MSEKKIAFLDIDGTLTRETDGSIPESASAAIAQARTKGNILFLCSGRTMAAMEPRFLAVGFDGVICGCGTQILLEDGTELLHRSLTPAQTRELLLASRESGVEILFEAETEMVYDGTRPLTHPLAVHDREMFIGTSAELTTDPDREGFFADKLCTFETAPGQMARFRETADRWLDTIDRGGGMFELVPRGFSKATGILRVLEHYGLPLENAYAFGDSTNDLPMLRLVPHSVVMGNADPPELKNIARHVAGKASEDGLAGALQALGFLG